MNLIEQSLNDITKETKIKYAKKECKNIGNLKRHRWTTDELSKLKILYEVQGASPSEMGNIFPERSKDSIMGQITKLKYKHTNEQKYSARSRTRIGKGLKHIPEIINGSKKWNRICPQCHKKIWYFDRSSVYRKSTKIKLCKQCKRDNKKLTYKRNCSKCDGEIIYSTRENLWRANRDKSLCRSCAKLGNPSRKGQKCSEIHKIRVGLSNKGKIISSTSKLKMREAAIRRMNRLGITQYRNYNPNACRYFDSISKEKGWNLQHAKNGGEVQVCGYFLDAYDKDKNIVVEYDEVSHNRPSVKQKDILRQNEIIEFLRCDFYRYKEYDSQLIKI